MARIDAHNPQAHALAMRGHEPLKLVGNHSGPVLAALPSPAETKKHVGRIKRANAIEALRGFARRSGAQGPSRPGGYKP
jgi:hypothetical protein